MATDTRTAPDGMVSAAEVARLAGVTRAAVSNWRRRYADFPAPVGAGRNALFPLAEVNAWLDRQHKRSEVATEVLVWQALRTQYHDDLVRGLADLAELFTTSAAATELGSDLPAQARALAQESSPAEAVEGLTDRLVDSAVRTGCDQATTRRISRAVRQVIGPISGTVFDPACGLGTLLLACGDSPEVTTLAGQELNPCAARLAAARVTLAARHHALPVTAIIKTGDSLRDDQWPELSADVVVCDPPASAAGWGREDLLLDSRWELGVPTRAEHELAWLQHAYAHVRTGGRAVVVMSASAAYRRSGRRIRAELVRRGILRQVVALPAGMAACHAQPVHLWILRRPQSAERPQSADLASAAVRMTDLTGNAPDGPFEPVPQQSVEVPLIDLLDETVDLTPAHHIAAACTDHLTEYRAARETLIGTITALLDQLPPLERGPGSLDGAMLRLADLIRAGLVEVVDGRLVSASDQLDADYLNGFLHSAANTARATSGSGTFRIDTRGSQVPQMGIGGQQAYGAAFRTLRGFEDQLRELADLGGRAANLARAGLANGTLRPASSARGD